MKKLTKILIISISGGLVLGGLGTFLGIHLHNKHEEETYQKGLEHLLKREHKQAYDTFSMIPDYLDANKKQDYAYQLYRIDQGERNFEDMINEVVLWNGKVEVSFETNGAKEIPSRIIDTKSETKYITEVPSKSFQDFLGWTLTYGSYNKDTDQLSFRLNASYSHHYYSIAYSLDGGVLPSNAPLHYTYYSPDVHLPIASKPGYNFLGWVEEDEDAPILDYVIPYHSHRDVTVKAKYEPKTIHVLFDGDGGTPSQAEGDYVYLSSVTLPTSTKENYVFDKWLYKGEPVNTDSFNVTEDNATLKASYLPKQFSIFYEFSSGESFSGDYPEVYNYESADILLPYPVKEKDSEHNYLFVGWTVEVNGVLVDDVIGINKTIPHHSSGNYNFIPHWLECEVDGHKLMSVDEGSYDNLNDITGVVIPLDIWDIHESVRAHGITKMVDIIPMEGHSRFVNENHFLIQCDSLGQRSLFYAARPVYCSPSCPETIHLPKVSKIVANALNGCQATHIKATSSFEEVGTSAFNSATNLVDIKGANLKHIGPMAFQNCTNLSEDFFKDNPNIEIIEERAFENCDAFTSITIEGKMRQIGAKAFHDINSLTTLIYYGEDGLEVHESAFEDCPSLTKLYSKVASLAKALSLIPNSKSTLEEVYLAGVGQLQDNTFKGYTALRKVEFALGVNLSSLSSSCFEDTSSLETFVVPNTVTRIESHAFRYSNIKSLTFEDISSLKRIEEGAFESSKIESIDFTGAKSLVLEDDAFKNCHQLTSVKLNYEQVESFNDVFGHCSNLSDVTIHFKQKKDHTLTLRAGYMSNFAFVKNLTIIYDGNEEASLKLNTGCFSNCPLLEDIVLDNCHISKVSEYVLENCVSFKNTYGYFNDLVTIPRGLFYGCKNISVSLNGTTSIEPLAFGHCRLLGTVYLPKTITSVGEEAFAYCEAPMSIEVEYTLEEMADLDKDDPTFGPQPWFNWSKNCFCSITFGVTH